MGRYKEEWFGRCSERGHTGRCNGLKAFNWSDMKIRKREMYKSIFSYYGSKSKIAHLYPPPQYPLIIEPFAGAASYSLRYRDREVWINDLNHKTAEIWRFLLSPRALIEAEKIPPFVVRGQKVSQILDASVPQGLLWLLQACANQGTAGSKGIHDIITPFAAKCWHRLPKKLSLFIPQINHWKITEEHYQDLPDLEATWFIDPPYNNSAGQRYQTSKIDYGVLAEWCRTRKGQVIVCENAGADWLPFVSLTKKRIGIMNPAHKSFKGEVVWTKSKKERIENE